jgi:hypothetical protein
MLVRDPGRSLLEWFPGHADYMDSALAAWPATAVRRQPVETVIARRVPAVLARLTLLTHPPVSRRALR